MSGTNFNDVLIAFINAWNWKKTLVVIVAGLLMMGIIHVSDIVQVFRSIHFK